MSTISSRSNGKDSIASMPKAISPQQPKLMLPREALQPQPQPRPNLTAPASWGGLAAASPASKPMCTPSNAASTAWRTTVCPFAPAPRRLRAPGSLDPTPTSSSLGLATPANIWPDPSPATFRAAPGTMPMFSGAQSPDVTPINAAGSNNNSTRSQSIFGPEFEWLRPLINADLPGVGSEPLTPSSLPTRGPSSMSLDPLNTAQIIDGSAPVTPCNADLSTKDAADGQAFFFSRPVPDNGPAFNFRHLGA